ncbi:DUF302 domain-containing protein [Haladaptatus sp. DFWS20]|uniref:DUF302 domain-containing protein n=1 Tax=Haladaptatus sp. DFWS20 TaxID=3403467 RepID=UPI003EBBD043
MPTAPRDRRAMLKLVSVLFAGGTFASPVVGTQQTTETTTGTQADENGLVTVESEQDFDATVERIEGDIENIDVLTLVTTVDHSDNAESAGLDLPPTTLFIFGNPELGTPLMQTSRTIGIDLPQKLLVWQDGETVNVTYNDPQYLANRHGIENQQERLDTIARTLRTLATGSSEGGSKGGDGNTSGS